VSVEPATDFPERFAAGLQLLWRHAGESKPLTLRAARPHGRRLLLTFEGIGDIAAARELAGGELHVPAERAVPAPEGFYYSHEVEGWMCLDPDGRELGRVTRLEETAAGPLLAIERPGKKTALVPFVRPIVAEIDRASRRIVLDPPAGLMEL